MSVNGIIRWGCLGALVVGFVVVAIIGDDQPQDAGATAETSEADSIAAQIGNATACEETGYVLTDKFSDDKQEIFACIATQVGSEWKCVTRDGSIITDETDTVRALFAQTIATEKPVCI